ncbi:MAG TPA: hypothetical protein VM577_11505 [Anaerovoracaceae bacterium]|nr:hypothetical protein [Anaerovoracaceae bacterium]
MGSVKVKVAKLAELIKPFSFSPPGWGKTPVTKNEIERALFDIEILNPEKKIKTRQDNVRRIAWYCAYGFGTPIKLKVISPTKIEVVEGHHQLRAAIVRGDTVVSVVVDGDPSTILSN